MAPRRWLKPARPGTAEHQNNSLQTSVIQRGCSPKHGLNNKQMVVTQYSKHQSRTTKGGLEIKWWGISGKIQFAGQNIMVTFHCANWKLTFGVLNHSQLTLLVWRDARGSGKCKREGKRNGVVATVWWNIIIVLLPPAFEKKMICSPVCSLRVALAGER